MHEKRQFNEEFSRKTNADKMKKLNDFVKKTADKLNCGYMFDTWQGANVAADKLNVKFPLILNITPVGGVFSNYGATTTNAPDCMIAFLTELSRQPTESEIITKIDEMLSIFRNFANEVAKSNIYEPLEIDNPYKVVFHRTDRNLIGVTFDFKMIPIEMNCYEEY